MKVVLAKVEDHTECVKVMAESKYTKTFAHIWFSASNAYSKGWIAKAITPENCIVGVACVRNLVRSPHTKLHFVGVKASHKKQGIGRLLLNWTIEQSSHKLVRFYVMTDNLEAIAFYDKLNAVVVGTENSKIWMEVKG